jgi:alpha-tubulin suppressor-like RCC1 family protein
VQVARPDGERFVAVSLGDLHSCALSASGRAYCWGRSTDGQLGAGTEPIACPIAGADACSTVPVAVALARGVRLSSIATGSSHTCGTTAAGEVYCWGLDYNGQLGVGEAVAKRAVPVLASALAGLSIRALAAGWHFTCGIADTGAAYCWGTDESGQLGDGPVEHDKGTCGIVCSLVPVQVMGSESADYVTIDATNDHVCAVTHDGSVQCWGAASAGRLGNGTNEHELCTISNGQMQACERAPVVVVGSGE